MLDTILSWPGVSRRELAFLLGDGAPRRAQVLDVRFLRPLRALGHTVTTTGTAIEGGKPQLICAQALNGKAEVGIELIAELRAYAEKLSDGGMVILRSTAKDRERVAAAFLHAGLRDVEQTRISRGYLTSGMV